MLIDANDLGRSANFDTAGKKYAAAYNNRGFKPDSVLHPIMLSDNGFSEKDANRRLLGGGMLPSDNGIAADTYRKKQPLLSPYASF